MRASAGSVVFILILSLVVPVAPAAAYAPQLTPDLVRVVQKFYKTIPADFLPCPSEWCQAFPDRQGFVLVATPFIRLAMGIAADEYIAHYDHTEAEYLNPIIVERLNQYYANTLLLYVELATPFPEPPEPPTVALMTSSGRGLQPRSTTLQNRPRAYGDGYTYRFNVEFSLSSGIAPTDRIRVDVRRTGRPPVTLTFDLSKMR